MTEPQEIWDEVEKPQSQAGLILGLWLTGVFLTSLGGWLEHGRSSMASMVPLGIAIVWPLVYFAVSRCRFVPRALPFGASLALALFALTSALSTFMSPVPLLSIGYVVLTLVGIWLALQFNSNLTGDQYEQGLKLFAMLMTGILISFAWYDYVPGKRLGTGRDVLNPNSIALVSASVLLAAMSIRALALRLVVMGPIAGIIVLTSSRAAAVAAVVGLATIVCLRLRANGTPVLRFAGVGLLLGAVLALLYGDALYRTLDEFYALSSADRGLGSGATGRTAAWKATWEMFLRNPVLGVGFRAHEQFLKIDSSAHNGYLATLAEIGIIGFLGVLFLVGRGARLLWAGAHDSEQKFSSSLLFGLCVGYLLLGIFERFLINVGNPTSLLFLLCIMRPDFNKMDRAEAGEAWLFQEETVAGELVHGVSRT